MLELKGNVGAIGQACKKCGADHWMYMKWKNGVHGKRCAKCMAKWQKAYHKKNPIYYKEKGWQNKGINITVREYNERFQKQGGACAVCGITNRKLRVDHCHVTGKIRGLLCSRCNAIAQDPTFVRLVLSYMENA